MLETQQIPGNRYVEQKKEKVMLRADWSGVTGAKSLRYWVPTNVRKYLSMYTW